LVADNKTYIQYYRRVLGLSPDMSLVKKAAAGDYTLTEFQLLVQRQDTNRFLRTAQGQEAAGNFRDLWATIFPSVGRQPGIKALRLFLKEKPAGKLRDVTNPTSRRDMYMFLAKTKLFKKVYPEFENTKFLRTLNFSGYREYKDQFKSIMRQYGQTTTDNDIDYFFNSDITPDQFESNLKIVLGGSGAYKWGTGEQLAQDQARRATYSRKGSVATLSKISNELEKQQSFMQSEQARFDVDRNDDTGRLEQTTAY